MNVLSLFDGMSCGQQALQRAGIKVDQYFASEIDKYAIQVTMANFPNTNQLGSVVNVDGYSLPKIDILIGGSPCQSFSFAGKRKGMATKDEQEILTLDHYLELKAEGFEFEGQSYLFWEYMRLLNETKPTYFLLENVMMGEKWEKVLSKAIGVKPIMINSALLSAQNRQRLYWTNIGLKPSGLFGDLESTIQQPKDKGILLKDVLESDVDDKYFLSEKAIKYVTDENRMKKRFTQNAMDANKSLTHCANNQTNFCGDYVVVHNMMPRSSKSGKGGSGHLCRTDGRTYCLDTGSTNAIEFRKVIQINESLESGGKQPYQQNRIYDTNGISPALCANKSDLLIKGARMTGRDPENPKSRKPCSNTEQMIEERFDNKSGTLTTVQKDNLVIFGCDYRTDEGLRIRENGKSGTLAARARNDESCGQLASINRNIRRLTPIECERLQTVADNYTNHVSDSQRYKMLGNGWTVDVIVHILNHIK
jgi:DNA (cytosine-5)-methyltransferase 3A